MPFCSSSKFFPSLDWLMGTANGYQTEVINVRLSLLAVACEVSSGTVPNTPERRSASA